MPVTKIASDSAFDKLIKENIDNAIICIAFTAEWYIFSLNHPVYMENYFLFRREKREGFLRSFFVSMAITKNRRTKTTVKILFWAP